MLETTLLFGLNHWLAALWLLGMILCGMAIIAGGNVIDGARDVLVTLVFGGPANNTAIHAAVTDNGAQQVITTGISQPQFASRISATAGGTATDIKAIQVTIAGLDPAGASITEALPAFTVDTAGTVTGLKVFATVTSITIPAHDGIGATTAIGIGGAPKVATTTGIHAAVTDNGTQQTITTAFTQPDMPRNITATAGGTALDIKAIQVTVNGTDAQGNVIQEVLPAFTVDTAGTVTGNKAFKTVTSVVIPAHDGTGATTAIGFGEKLGLGLRLARKTVVASYLAEVIEGTAATQVVDATALESNTVDLNSALNSTQVKVQLSLT